MALRLVEMVIPTAAADDSADWLESVDVLGVWRELTDDEHMVVRVLVKSDGAEPVINALQEGLGSYEDFRVMLFEVEATLPRPEQDEEKSNDKPDDPESEKKKAKANGRIAVEELVEKLGEQVRINRYYLITVIVASVVAAIGLIRDDVAVIIGSMVIAPLLGPNMALSLATTLGDLKMLRRAFQVNFIGVVIAAAVAILFGLLWKIDPAVEQIARRSQVAFSDILVAMAAGVAGALAFTTGLPAALVGVMVAVALLPPLVVAGMLIGSGDWGPAAQAGLLLATNIICVNLAGVATFLLQGVRPMNYHEEDRARTTSIIAVTSWLILLGLLASLIWLAQHLSQA